MYILIIFYIQILLEKEDKRIKDVLKDKEKLDKSQTSLESYKIVKSSSTKCMLSAHNDVRTASYTNSNESLIRNLNTYLLDKGKLLIK